MKYYRNELLELNPFSLTAGVPFAFAAPNRLRTESVSAVRFLVTWFFASPTPAAPQFSVLTVRELSIAPSGQPAYQQDAFNDLLSPLNADFSVQGALSVYTGHWHTRPLPTDCTIWVTGVPTASGFGRFFFAMEYGAP